jgi:hypothetical protein
MMVVENRLSETGTDDNGWTIFTSVDTLDEVAVDMETAKRYPHVANFVVIKAREGSNMAAGDEYDVRSRHFDEEEIVEKIERLLAPRQGFSLA